MPTIMLIANLALILWVAFGGYHLGKLEGHERGMESSKAIYKPEIDKRIDSIRQLREAAVSYGYATWEVTDNTHLQYRPSNCLRHTPL